MASQAHLDHIPTWAELVRVRPQLAEIIAQAKSDRRHDPEYREDPWWTYEKHKRSIAQIVGRSTHHDLLGSHHAYLIAIGN